MLSIIAKCMGTLPQKKKAEVTDKAPAPTAEVVREARAMHPQEAAAASA